MTPAPVVLAALSLEFRLCKTWMEGFFSSRPHFEGILILGFALDRSRL